MSRPIETRTGKGGGRSCVHLIKRKKIDKIQLTIDPIERVEEGEKGDDLWDGDGERPLLFQLQLNQRNVRKNPRQTKQLPPMTSEPAKSNKLRTNKLISTCHKKKRTTHWVQCIAQCSVQNSEHICVHVDTHCAINFQIPDPRVHQATKKTIFDRLLARARSHALEKKWAKMEEMFFSSALLFHDIKKSGATCPRAVQKSDSFCSFPGSGLWIQIWCRRRRRFRNYNWQWFWTWINIKTVCVCVWVSVASAHRRSNVVQFVLKHSNSHRKSERQSTRDMFSSARASDWRPTIGHCVQEWIRMREKWQKRASNHCSSVWFRYMAIRPRANKKQLMAKGNSNVIKSLYTWTRTTAKQSPIKVISKQNGVA